MEEKPLKTKVAEYERKLLMRTITWVSCMITAVIILGAILEYNAPIQLLLLNIPLLAIGFGGMLFVFKPIPKDVKAEWDRREVDKVVRGASVYLPEEIKNDPNRLKIAKKILRGEHIKNLKAIGVEVSEEELKEK